MFYIENDNKIVLADNDKGRLITTLKFMPQYAEHEIKETDKDIENSMFVDSPEWIEWKSKEVRNLRNYYLEQYVDSIVSNPLRWNDLSTEEQDNIKNYRRYLLDITDQSGFPKVNLLTYSNWLMEKK